MEKVPSLIEEATLSEDFPIPLLLARRHVLKKTGYFSLFAYLTIREYEDSRDGLISHSPEEISLEIYHLYPDFIDQISAQAIHFFLKTEQPFDTWKSEIFKVLDLVNGRHYFTDLPRSNPAGAKSGISSPDGEDVRLTIEAAIRMGAATPTSRGRKIAAYFSELDPPVRL